MGIFDVGPLEVLLILIIALIFLGPGKLPEVGARAGKAVRDFRRAADDVRHEITREAEPAKRPPPHLPGGEEGPPPPSQTKAGP